ncbi:hypothetical protein Dshi_0488 [Dinoroseobacter shibae DFL 12 = DSM 16493]|jgi:hypothetical protein|uniref:Uncharacterized protein n=1 Tax=Dinoroseobacter shibae (strain DSM 16493 / NCIMB 14021 / DFL 12) TaxID=398580 RepID=A8LNS8_DINSH|nr:hypothetical protein [Dinoroseobacter shibae]ABV92236.1 hypothetical protein Dshi_0488 [Dinoroseobacter shibae DFL 12 = DSM 16493]URF47187.1 hypothetical protein M8008_02495 [Dinoroseobacter shibae]URF51498.1 hypothetical protein M8007_02495 [Dinoroseobacter shibae]
MPEDTPPPQSTSKRPATPVEQSPIDPVPSPTADPPPGQEESEDRFLRRFVVITATLVASTIAIGIIFITALLPFYSDQNAPEQLVNWGGIIIGFYFGTFASLLKDWLSSNKSTGGAR